MTLPIKTLLADDQALFREALHTLLALDCSVEVVAEAANGAEALHLTAQHLPQVVLMDLRMPVMSGAEATRRIRSMHPDVRVLILTLFDQEEDVFEALRAGASGYVLKSSPPSQLVDAIKIVAAGQTYLQPSIATQVVTEFNRLSLSGQLSSEDRRLASQLSQREVEILQHLVRGMSNKEIATALGITEGTVKNHMTRILDKLQVPDRTGAALKARDLGLG
ncbi:MAG: DNA-binding response regulator [Verrucomicrobia bacterium 12-59-8]|nr:MAG: DNA-binding response regulator [Verrucomicrobia bacterium 12-59-8]